MERRFTDFAVYGCLALLLVLASSAGAAVYTYDAGLGTLPASQGWSVTHYAGSPFFSTSTQQVVGGALVVHDTDSGVPGYDYSSTHPGVTITSSTGWQMRSLVRIENDVTGTSPIYAQVIADTSGRSAGIGIRYDSGTASNVFFFWNNTNLSRGSVTVPWDATSYYQVVLTKPNGSPSVTETLEVLNAAGTISLGSINFNFASESGGLADPAISFGNGQGGAPLGTFDLKSATFVIPEPTALSLAALGTAAVAFTRSRRSAL